MVELCFSARGTQWTGLYRGLKRMTDGTDFAVETLVADLDSLRELETNGEPVILTVRLTQEAAKTHPIYANDWGWVPSLSHNVLFYGFADNDRVEIGDPSVGREQWTEDDLRLLRTGAAQRLVRQHRAVAGP